MFYAGKSTTPQELYLVNHLMKMILLAGDGAGSIKVDDTIVGLKVFRDSLFIFCDK